jgi:hypothetical protein
VIVPDTRRASPMRCKHRVQRHVPVGDHDAAHAHVAQALERGRRLRIGPGTATHPSARRSRCERQVAPRFRERRAQRRCTAPAQHEQRGRGRGPRGDGPGRRRSLRVSRPAPRPRSARARPLAQLRLQAARGRLELHERSHGIEEDGRTTLESSPKCRADSE